MMMMTNASYLTGGEQASSLRSQQTVLLSERIELVLESIYKKHNSHPPIKAETRRILSSIPEQLVLETLSKVHNSTYVKTLDGFIIHIVDTNGFSRPSSGDSPVPSPSTPSKKSSRLYQEISLLDYESPSPPKLLKREDKLLALAQLEFRKAFLLLSYTHGKPMSEVNVSVDEIMQWNDLPMVAYEATIWNRFGWLSCSQKDRKASLQWDSGKTHYYQCHVSTDGSYRFQGPIMENTGTHLHNVLGDDNVLTVKFEDVPGVATYSNDIYAKYKEIAKNGIMVGLRRYQFFVFKDGGKEEKKRDFSTKGVKCYFIRTDSTTANDLKKPYIFSGKSINEARMHFMHVNTLPSLAKYMARFSLILSKTKTLEVDMARINFKPIEDIHCKDQNKKDVFDKNGKPHIHSDGTGYISEDLARMCPTDIYKGKCITSNNQVLNFEAEPPLLIQFRMFYNGYAVKGTFLTNKKLPPRTVQVRPSMIKVYNDQTSSNLKTFNSIEVVTTSNPPRNKTKLSRNLIALLSYGGVPNDFFLDILHNTLEKSKTVFYKKRAALKAALNYGDMDDNTATQMILAGIPLDEPHLKDHLSILSNTEKNDLKAGKLPVTESYYLMGTVDPTGKLKENQVSVILESGQVSGDVLVYRNPGLHFGDIHVLKATYVEGLEEYVGNSKYGVFFPQKGPRSLGDEIAGGDFDGDMYFVSRNPKLLEHFKPSEAWVSSSPPSRIYTGREPSELSPELLEEELFKMFLKARFQSSSVIGQAADSWLAIMDRYLMLGDKSVKEKAERKKKMLKAIDIYYDALDAPKAGAKVDLPLDLKLDVFPHYMERKKEFKSTSILGLMYDLVVSHKEPPPSEIKKLRCFEDELVPEFLMEECKLWYKRYRDEMCEAMGADEDDKNELANEKKELANAVLQKYKQEFYGAARFEDSKKSLEELYTQALALYNVVYDHAIIKNKVRSCGFAWKVAGPVLCRFYLKKTEEKSFPCSTSVLKELF